MSALHLFEVVNLGKKLTFESFYEWRVVHEVHCFHHLPYDLYIWMYARILVDCRFMYVYTNNVYTFLICFR